MRVNWKTLFLCILFVFLVGFIGSILMNGKSNGDWYKETRPSITPPGFVFPIVWNILYLLISISLYLSITSSKKKLKKKLILVFAINLFLNGIWTFFYFNLENPLLAFIDILFILATIIYLIFLTYRVNKVSSYLLYPYLIWVSFASVLNFLSI